MKTNNKRKFHAHIEISYVPRCLYVVNVRVGRRVITFDPKDGQKRSVRLLSEAVEYLKSKREYINDFPRVLTDFVESGRAILQKLSEELGMLTPKEVFDSIR